MIRPSSAIMHSGRYAGAMHSGHKRSSIRRLPYAANRTCVGAVTVHSITLAALIRSDGGIVRPVASAVLRLMHRSSLVGASTGRLAGFARRNMRCRSQFVSQRNAARTAAAS